MMRRLGACLAALLVGACEQSMTEMPRYDPYDPAPMFSNGASARMPVASTVGRDANLSDRPARIPLPVNQALLNRGRERFGIFCSPCHGLAGDGDGPVVQRGFPKPPSYHQDALRQAPDSHFYDVISQGYGAMFSYASRISPEDRWAIVAYVRALQYSRYVDARSLPQPIKHELDAYRDGAD